MNVYRCSQHRSRCPTVSDVSCVLLCARKTLLHPERYYPHARIRVFHHSGPEIPGSAREGKPRSFFLCFVKIFKKVDRLSENDASSSATRKWLLLTSKSLFLTSKSEMLTSKSL